MVASNSTVSPGSSSYRVDVVRGDQGNMFQVVRCGPLARFDDAEHAAFLVDLLTKGGAHHV
jgi:hypothetical protein